MIKEGSTVKVHYTGRTEGKNFDTSEGKDPLQFTVGTRQVIEGFETAVMGLKVGDKTTTQIEPDQAYGAIREEMIMEVPKGNVPEGVEEGAMLKAANEQGQEINVFVNEVKEETVIVDANHPLAGKVLEFDIEVVDIVEATEEASA